MRGHRSTFLPNDKIFLAREALQQLRQLPFTELKIDRFFLTDMIASADSQLIVKTMIDLAHGLGLTATAEGVETEEQLLLLRELGCDVAQGYLIATPLPPEELADWSTRWSKRWKKIISPPAATSRKRVRAHG